MTTIEALVQEGLIRHLPADPRRVDEALSLADRDLAVAGRVLELDPDWAYAIAYNAMLQAARALLFADGYRPAGKNQHVAVVRFVAVRIGPDEAAGLDRLRRKRHITIDDTAGTIGALEAGGGSPPCRGICRPCPRAARSRAGPSMTGRRSGHSPLPSARRQ